MVRCVIGNNAHREPKFFDKNTTIRSALEQINIDYSRGMTSLDGCTLNPSDFDKTFEDFGITESCYLLNVAKTDNA